MTDKLIAKTKEYVSLKQSKTRHTVEGETRPDFASLKIIQIEGDNSYYLFYYDLKGTEITDTYHDTVDLALEQAKFEFGLNKTDWDFTNG